MVNTTDLIDNKPKEAVTENWSSTKSLVRRNIDQAIARGNVDMETLLIMKELLEACRPTTMEDYLEEERSDN